MSAVEDLHELGRRIRLIRLDRRMTLKQVEAASGLSATHLSEIERGRTSPTLGALIRIARSLRKEPAFFLEDEALEDVADVGSGNAPTLSLAHGVTARVLTPGIPGGGISAYRVTFGASRPSELRLPLQQLAGDVLYLVVRGAVEAAIGEERLRVSEGDSVHASLQLEHRVRPASGEPAELILVSTRPLSETGPRSKGT